MNAHQNANKINHETLLANLTTTAISPSTTSVLRSALFLKIEADFKHGKETGASQLCATQ